MVQALIIVKRRPRLAVRTRMWEGCAEVIYGSNLVDSGLGLPGGPGRSTVMGSGEVKVVGITPSYMSSLAYTDSTIERDSQ